MTPIETIDKWLETQGLECDPYGHMTWSVGIGDEENLDVICVDHAVGNDGHTAIIAVIDSENGSFTDTFYASLISTDEALPEAWLIASFMRDCLATWIQDRPGVEWSDNLGEWIETITQDISRQKIRSDIQ